MRGGSLVFGRTLEILFPEAGFKSLTANARKERDWRPRCSCLVASEPVIHETDTPRGQRSGRDWEGLGEREGEERRGQEKDGGNGRGNDPGNPK